jgi:hypothetical protein
VTDDFQTEYIVSILQFKAIMGEIDLKRNHRRIVNKNNTLYVYLHTLLLLRAHDPITDMFTDTLRVAYL